MINKGAVLITAIVAIMLLEGYALYLGYNGLYFTIVIAAISACAGIEVKSIIEDVRRKNNGNTNNH